MAALPCEDAAASAAMGDNRVTLQRVFYDLYAAAFPAGFERLNVATVWMGGEPGREYAVGVRLSDPGGAIVAEARLVYTAHPQPATAVAVAHLSSDGALTLALPAPGRYAIDILLDGVPAHTFPLFVIGPAEKQG
jgi:hypothetical protein